MYLKLIQKLKCNFITIDRFRRRVYIQKQKYITRALYKFINYTLATLVFKSVGETNRQSPLLYTYIYIVKTLKDIETTNHKFECTKVANTEEVVHNCAPQRK